MEEKSKQAVVELRHQLHAHPELSEQESWTKKRLMDFLRENTSLRLVDKGRWFYVVYQSQKGGRNIAFRADMDAVAIDEATPLSYRSTVPGVSHKCGHDGHSAALAGFAMEIDQQGCDNNIFFLFQHAEENAAGARECVALLEEENIDEIFGLHNMPGIAENAAMVEDGTMCCASAGMVIHMQGAPAHASLPEQGKNPAFAISEIVGELARLADPARYQGLVLCTVIQIDVGSANFGIAASEGKLLLTVRGQYEKELDALRAELEALAAQKARQYGLACDISYQDVFPETANHPASAEKMRSACRTLGIGIHHPPDGVPMRSSEDFGHYLKARPGAFLLLGAGDRPPIHTFDYDYWDALIEPSVELFNLLARGE